jgi:transcriptional regulator with XRE-family HTH domain
LTQNEPAIYEIPEVFLDYPDFRMRSDFLQQIGAAIRAERRRRGLNQADLAARLGRSPSRVSELEQDLLKDRRGKDRLTLLADICDALDLTLVAKGADQRLGSAPPGGREAGPRTSVFDDVFVDLGEGATEDDGRG